ncbi:actin-related protein 8-like [Rhopilema esculentum]|uniref:actin-related protein 8-like n=1 Tax=Rhopilema esculentum TaxID=499914 RepID=UPI0031DE80D2
MPRPQKAEKPIFAEPIAEPIQGTTIVVLHPGSSTLQLGRATDHFPQSLPHVIAYRCKEDGAFCVKETNSLIRNGIWHPDSEEKRQGALQATNQLINAMRVSFGYRRPHISIAQIASFNNKVIPDTIQGESGVCWSDVSENPEILIGEQAQYLDPNAPYETTWPIRNGTLNIHNGIGGSLSSVSSKLETLWSLAIQMFLDIPAKDFQYYRVVLVVPDIVNRHHLKEIYDILLNRLGFSAVIMHQESVCATFGSGLPSACVVDVGDQKTSICCVEDGISLPNSRIKLNYGGSDITRCFNWLLQRISFPYKECDINDKLDIYLLQDLKETFCHLSLDIPVGHVHEFQVYRPQESGLLYQIKLGDEPLQAPIAYFIPRLLGLVGQKVWTSNLELADHDPEDLYDDKYLLEVQLREPSAKKGRTDLDTSSELNERVDSILLHVGNSKQGDFSRSHLNCTEIEELSIDQAISKSIESCGSYETKRKMYSTILIVGGGMMFKGANNFLMRRVQAQVPTAFHFMRDQMEVITRPKDMDPRTVCWKGGAVLSILDSAQELWINRKELNDFGVRILREKSAFQWSVNLSDKQ